MSTILPLLLRDVSFAAGGRTIIDRVSVELTHGPRTVILGANVDLTSAEHAGFVHFVQRQADPLVRAHAERRSVAGERRHVPNRHVAARGRS